MSQNAPATVRYALDAGRSTFTVQAFATGLLSGFGHDPTIEILDFTGEARFDPQTLANASIRAVARTGSLRVVDDVKEKDRQEIERTMLDEVLEVARHPEATFESTSITVTRIVEGRYKARIVGDLTLHGATRKGLWIMAQVIVSGESGELRARGEFALKQTEFGIKPVSVAAGALKLKDEVKLTFDLVGREASGDA
jgi:polyisoprenoid-binding protein YceI